MCPEVAQASRPAGPAPGPSASGAAGVSSPACPGGSSAGPVCRPGAGGGWGPVGCESAVVCVHPHVSVCVSGHTCTQVSTRGCECALHTRRPSSPSRCASRDCSDAPQGLLLCPWCFPPACPLAPRGGGLGRPSAPGSPPLPGFLSRFRVCWWRGRRGPGGGAVWPSPAGLRGVWPRPRRPAAPRPRCGLQAPAQREAPGGTGLPVPRVWAEGQRPSRRPACDAPTPPLPAGRVWSSSGRPARSACT